MMASSAADLKFLHRPAASSFRNFKSKSGTRIITLLVPLCFRSSCQRVPRCITNFGSGALGKLLRERMETERPSPRYADIDIWDPAEILDAMIEGQFTAVAA